ncbi:glutamine amidotransferase [Fulvimarina sp. 2208YS6-2-32]|uniref:Glutamine amidotransferase n=1 Tax=Fulvimarina uroteuthidis TaxID=3098149 RepID=A0ABU5I6M7_9HYPH|nr:glutamine amidotransferase [Fulvimarina sp. 2208YS6-2-32]MDY8111045.1 glutamine amidotransferase [Fulvimarina sp. 2208YS6-2-32]
MSKSALILRHLAFEDLGGLGPVLEDEGYRLSHAEAGIDALPDALGTDLLVVLGGPIGVNDMEAYPCMKTERIWLAPRLAARRPTLGICLGAQLMAAALGARVAAMPRKEIGFSALTLTERGINSPLRHLRDGPVLHWHGEAFDIPDGADSLAGTAACATQAFAMGPTILGLQFHPEAGELPAFERWLIGHSVELAEARIDPASLRRDAIAHGPALRRAGQSMLRAWLRDLPA